MGRSSEASLGDALRDLPASAAGVAVRRGGGDLPEGCPRLLSSALALAAAHGVERVASGTLPDGMVVSRQDANAWFSNAAGESLTLLAGEALVEGGVRRTTLALATALGTSSLAARPRGPFPSVVIVAEGMRGPCRVSPDAPDEGSAELLAGVLDALDSLGPEATASLLVRAGLKPSKGIAEGIHARMAPEGVMEWIGDGLD